MVDTYSSIIDYYHYGRQLFRTALRRVRSQKSRLGKGEKTWQIQAETNRKRTTATVGKCLQKC